MSKDFNRFGQLPVELRLKIWNFAAQEPRLIEIEYPEKEDEDSIFFLNIRTGHSGFQVSRRSRIPPSILQVNAEARAEGLRWFERRNFNSFREENEKFKIYYNPDSDIIFFGDQSCVSTMVQLSVQQNVHPVKRVAFCNTGKISRCCSIAAGQMQSLHGFFDEDTVTYPGYKGLQEVFILVQSKLWPRYQGEIDWSVGFRPSVHDGLTKGQVANKRNLMQDIANTDKCGGPIGVGSNVKWIGDAKPTFHFVHFRPLPIGLDERVHDGIPLSTEGFRILRARDYQLVRGIERSSGCILTVSNQSFYGEQREVGFFGTTLEQIEEAKSEIRKAISSI